MKKKGQKIVINQGKGISTNLGLSQGKGGGRGTMGTWGGE